MMENTEPAPAHRLEDIQRDRLPQSSQCPTRAYPQSVVAAAPSSHSPPALFPVPDTFVPGRNPFRGRGGDD